MALVSGFKYLNPDDVLNRKLTPERTNYLDEYDLRDYEIPHLRSQIIQKYNPTITGFIEMFAGKEQIHGEQYVWGELEHPAISYDDAVFTVSGGDNILSRAGGEPVLYRKHEKVKLHHSSGSGVFIVLEVVSSTQVRLGTYDEGSMTMVSNYSAPLESVFVFSLGIETKRGSLGADYVDGLKLPYKILSNIPAVTREQYSEDHTATQVVKWLEINGQPKWILPEIAETRRKFFEAIEKKLVNGTYPAAGSDAESELGLQGTQGFFDALRERAGTWDGLVTRDIADLESIIKHLNKVQGVKNNLFLCNQDQEFEFDALGRTFNSSYGADSGDTPYPNHIGTFSNGTNMLKLGYKGFEYGGYVFVKHGWKYLKENTFMGNEAIPESQRVNFVMVPLGQTPVTEGNPTLQTSPRVIQRHYLTNLYLRDYAHGMDGSLDGSRLGSNGDDKFTIWLLNESMLVVFAAEKFLYGVGSA